MSFTILDAGGAGLIFIAYTALAIFMVLAILLEAWVMMLMHYNSSRKKLLLDSLLANVVSLVGGFILLEFFSAFFDSYTVYSTTILYAITVVIEFGILKILNPTHTVGRTLTVAAVMNLLTYVILYLIGNSS